MLTGTNKAMNTKAVNNRCSVYADVFRPKPLALGITYDLLLILIFSLAIVLSAQVSIPLPFSPVPITGQSLVVLLSAVILGSKRGLLSVIAYIFLGVIGMPAFAGGASGFARILGPTGGYIVGFAVSAYIVGWLAEKGWDKSLAGAFFAMLIGNAVIYAVGLPRLAFFVGVERVFAMGLFPFIPGDVLKLLLATLALPAFAIILRRG